MSREADGEARERPVGPGDAGRGLLRAVPLSAIAILLLNDHVLKSVSPGALTGKLSDVAGLLFFPALLVAAVELSGSTLGRPVARPRRLLAWAVLLTGVVFTIVKVWPTATHVWAAVLGTAQWPVAAALAAVGHDPIPGWRPVGAVTDPTDLIALPALLLAWLDARWRSVGRPARLSPEVRVPARPGPTVGRVRARLLPVAVLVLAGSATLATSPATGTPTAVQLPISVELTREHPVAVQTFELTVDARAVTGPMTTVLSVGGTDPGVRYLLIPPEERQPFDRPGPAVLFGRCASEPCAHTVTVITELLDPSTGPLTARATVEAQTQPATANEQVPADRITLVERGQAQFRAAPARVRTELAGQDTIGPANPLVEHHIKVHREPGLVTDPTQFFVTGRLRLEAPNGPATIVLNMGAPTLDQATGESSLVQPREVDLPLSGDCPTARACDVDYVIRLKAASAATAPSVVRWTIALEMDDYAAIAAPADRAISADLAETRAVGPAPVTLRQTTTGQYTVTEDRDPPSASFALRLDPSIATLPDGSPRSLLVSYALTLSGMEPGGPVTHERPPLDLRLCPVMCVGGTFNGDGGPHTFRRYELVTCKGTADCAPKFDFDVFIDEAGFTKLVATPIPLDWTLQVDVTAWGAPALPADARFEIQALPPK